MDVLLSTDRVRNTIVQRLRQGAVAILATDTIYGLSCDATNPTAVARIHAIKQRQRPCSIVPPSDAYARRVVVEPGPGVFDACRERYAGPWTLFFRRRPGTDDLAFADAPLVALRFPDDDILALAHDVGRPLITTSVNRTTAPFMTDLDDLDPGIAAEVDFIVWDGPRRGRPSALVYVDDDCREEPR